MTEIRKIMAALAFSEHAAGIYRFAAKLAGALDANLLVASVVNRRDVDAVQTISAMGYDVDGERYVEAVRQERRKSLEDIIRAQPFSADRLEILIRMGDPADELLKIAVEKDVDLVVLGIKGRSNLEYVFVGSVADKMFRRSPVPVVSYREGADAERLRSRIRLD